MLPYQPMGFKYQAIKERWKRGIALMNYWFLNCRLKLEVAKTRHLESKWDSEEKAEKKYFHLYSRVWHVCHTVRDGKRRKSWTKWGESDCIFLPSLPFQMEKIFPSCKLCLFCKTVATYVAMQIHLCANQIVVRNSIQYCICSRPPIDHSCTHT